jgi:hypothetical protein
MIDLVTLKEALDFYDLNADTREDPYLIAVLNAARLVLAAQSDTIELKRIDASLEALLVECETVLDLVSQSPLYMVRAQVCALLAKLEARTG